MRQGCSRKRRRRFRDKGRIYQRAYADESHNSNSANPVIGYDRAQKPKKAVREKKTVKQVVVEMGLLTKKRLKRFSRFSGDNDKMRITPSLS